MLKIKKNKSDRLWGRSPKSFRSAWDAHFNRPRPEARIGMKRLDKFPESPFDN